MYVSKLSAVEKKEGAVSGYVDTVEQALVVLKCYETETTSQFVCIKRPAGFGKQGLENLYSTSSCAM